MMLDFNDSSRVNPAAAYGKGIVLGKTWKINERHVRDEVRIDQDYFVGAARLI